MNAVPEKFSGSDLRSRTEVLQWLADRGRDVKDPKGLIVGTMRKDLNKGRALSALVGQMVEQGMLERDTGTGNGRRTFRLKIVNDWGLLKGHKRNSSAKPAVAQLGTQPENVLNLPAEEQARAVAEELFAIVLRKATGSAADERTKKRFEDQAAELRTAKRELAEATAALAEAQKETETMRAALLRLQAEEVKPKSGGALVDRLKPAERDLLAKLATV